MGEREENNRTRGKFVSVCTCAFSTLISHTHTHTPTPTPTHTYIHTYIHACILRYTHRHNYNKRIQYATSGHTSYRAKFQVLKVFVIDRRQLVLLLSSSAPWGTACSTNGLSTARFIYGILKYITYRYARSIRHVT